MVDETSPSRSGRLNLRLPPELHAALAAEAERQDRSLNNLIVRLLSSGVGWQAPKRAGSRPKR
jgi:predicted HicB family RNase H-like nuclease